MSSQLDRLVTQEVAPGVYRMDMSLQPGSICRSITNAGWQCAYLDGSMIHNKESLLRECATALLLPDYFGYNWDALEECMTEPGLFHGPALVLLYDHAANLFASYPRDWTTFFDITTSAIQYWAEHDRAVYLILRNCGAIPQKVASL